jgi:hypothetical protein
MRRILLSLLVLASCASDGSTDLQDLTEAQIRGVWVFSGSGDGICPYNISVEVSDIVLGNDGHTIRLLSGHWTAAAGDLSSTFTGSGDTATGAFRMVLSVTSPHAELSGTLRADGTATARFSQSGCEQTMTATRS